MQLFHYRSVRSALLEIENGTFHFAERKELNDPLEGFVHVYWQGDKAAWEGLFKHYMCSIANAVELYLLAADKERLQHNSIEMDIHRWDDVPFGAMLLNLRTKFLKDPDVQMLAEFYGGHRFKVYEKELRFIFRLIHKKALVMYLRDLQTKKLMPEEEAANLIKMFDVPLPVRNMLSQIESRLSDEKKRIHLIESIETGITDQQEFLYMQAANQNGFCLYGDCTVAQDGVMEKKTMSKIYQQRMWLTVASDFPINFVEQLKEMIYPESYVVCFSGKNNDSSMWGNYADCHRGVCLVYDIEEDSMISVKKSDLQERKLYVKPVMYGGDIIERNFFQTLGPLNGIQLKEWLSGTEDISSYYDEICSDKTGWRDRYWEVFDAKTYRKTKEWDHENEYRAAIDNFFHEFDDQQKRNLKFDWKILKGVIFGIGTTEYDKKKIWDALMKHKEELTDFTFYQAEYDEEADQKIYIRKKAIWKLL